MTEKDWEKVRQIVREEVKRAINELERGQRETLRELVRGITPQNRHDEVDFGRTDGGSLGETAYLLLGPVNSRRLLESIAELRSQ